METLSLVVEIVAALLTASGMAYGVIALWGARDFGHYWRARRSAAVEEFAPDKVEEALKEHAEVKEMLEQCIEVLLESEVGECDKIVKHEDTNQEEKIIFQTKARSHEQLIAQVEMAL